MVKNLIYTSIGKSIFDHSTFVSETTNLYRFISLESLLKILSGKTIRFSNPTEWDDPFEKHFLNAEFKIGKKNYTLPLRDRAYCLCFTGTYSSEAYWYTYIRNNDGVRISVQSEALIKYLQDQLLNNRAIETIYIGKVKYEFQKNIDAHKKELGLLPGFKDSILNNEIIEEQVKLLLFKRNAFAYENERRIIIVKKSDVMTRKSFIDLKIDPLELFQNTTIVLDHRLGSFTADHFITFLKKYFGTSTIRIVKSGLTDKKYSSTTIVL